MKLIWISLTTWSRDRTGQNPPVHITIGPVALLQAGLNISIKNFRTIYNVVCVLIGTKSFAKFCVVMIGSILSSINPSDSHVKYNIVFFVKGKRRLMSQKRQIFLQSCLRTARLPFPACRSLNMSVPLVGRSSYLEILLRRL